MRSLYIPFFILVSLLSLPANAAKIYTWVGQDGQVHYSSTPPPEVDAKSTGLQTAKPKPEKTTEDADEDSLTAEDRIKKLEERIKRLEKGDVDPEKSPKSGKGEKDSDSDQESASEEEDEKPDFSVQGQMKMLEAAKRREGMITRCRAKAPHGTDCSKPAYYENY
jgi:hypothetical protein